MNEQLQALIAHNDATFRIANERIAAAADRAQIDAELLPFLCECADEGCTMIVRLTRAEYERIRSDPTHFLCVPGHEVAAGAAAFVVEANERFAIVEKTGRAAEVAERLDTRATG